MRFFVFFLLAAAILSAQTDGVSGVRAVLDEQMRAWNAGDLPTFVKTYAPDAIFVGKEVTRGNAGLLDRYRRNYPTRERMGTLKFTDVEVKLLDPDYASVLGRFHLTRTEFGGGDSEGVFTLLLRRTGKRWVIILDHTS